MSKLRAFAALPVLLSLVACGNDETDEPQAKGSPAAVAPDAPITQPLPDSGFKVEWGLPGIPAKIPAGKRFAVGVIVTNAGDQVWLDDKSSDPARPGAGAIRLAARWLKTDKPGQDVPYPQLRGQLPGPLMPGGSTVMAVEVAAPTEPGTYFLQLDLCQELFAWFETRGAARLVVPVTVSAS